MPAVCIGGVDREERCSLAKRRPGTTSPEFDPLPLRPGRYASLAGGTCFENSDMALPWGFDTSTFRSGAAVQRKHAGPSPRRVSDRNRPASPGRHRIMAVRRVLSPEAGGRVPPGGTEAFPSVCDSHRSAQAVRSSSAVERVAVNHRRRGFDALLRSPGAVTEDSGTRLQPGPRW